MNNRGGRRPGAGRPIGSKNQRSAEIARAAAESGITPIEVMLGTMRELWAKGTPEAKREAARGGIWSPVRCYLSDYLLMNEALASLA
jgi:hypothetical protein